MLMGESDAVCSYPAALGQGEIRWFELRDGLELAIDKFCLKDALVMTHCDRHHPLEYTFERSCQRCTTVSQNSWNRRVPGRS